MANETNSPVNPDPSVTPPADPPAPTPEPEPPPASRIVVTRQKTEREIELERSLAEAEERRTKAERDAAYALDERDRLRRLMDPDVTGLPRPRQPKKKRVGVGFFEVEED